VEQAMSIMVAVVETVRLAVVVVAVAVVLGH
jgi:hypothetical protein